ncbi:MAG: EAL domain-containing protein [Pseudomonadota bacterium]
MGSGNTAGLGGHPAARLRRQVMLITMDSSLGISLGQMIADEWDMVCVSDCAQARAALAGVSACLIDAWMPGALSLLVRARKENVPTPIIWLGSDDEFTSDAIRHAGAIDCLSLEILDGPLLKRTLSYACERMEAKRQLRESQQQLLQIGEVTQNLLADLRDATLLADEKGRIIYANLAAGRLFGMDPVQLVGHTCPDLMPEEDGLYEVETTIGDSARILDLQMSRTLWHGEQARLVSVRDITQRRQMEDRLRRAYRALDAATNGVVIADISLPEWPLVYANPAYEQLTGYSAEEVLGRPGDFIRLESVDPAAAAKVRSAVGRGQPCRITVHHRRKDGSPFWCEMALSPVRNEADEITHYVIVINDVTEQTESRERLEWLSMHDSICGLLNQNGLQQYIGPWLEMARARHETLHVFWMNIDSFHEVNDNFGYEAGNQVIVEAARRLRARVGEEGLLARIGGDEFIFVANDIPSATAASGFAHELCRIFARPFEIKGLSLRLTCCVGISRDNDSVKDGTALIGNADIALHQAKNISPNSIAWFSMALAEKARNAASERADLQRAIEQREFIMHYQPQVDAANGQVTGVEAVLRWQHPLRGLLLPEQFLPLAEATGQINNIGALALEMACRDGCILRAAGLPNAGIAVNISASEFQSEEFIDRLQASLRTSGLPPECLEIELGESAIPENGEEALKRIEALRRTGVRIVRDNFGRGMSDLYHLRGLPLHKIKIDRSFIHDIISDARAAAITRGIVSMAQSLHMQVVADAVESEPQRAFLRRMRIETIQGYLVAPPMPLAAFLEWTRQRQVDMPAPAASNGGGETKTILLVDDEPNILRALSRLLRRDGYRIHVASSAREAFAILAQNDVQVIISDQRMPEVCGTEFLAQVKDLYPDTVRMVLSGYTDLKTVTDAINEGAIYRFLTKPWNDDALREDVRKAFARRLRHAEDSSTLT